MWTTKTQLETSATKERIWTIWSAVDQWNAWDDAVIMSSLDEDTFELGRRGKLKPKGGPEARFMISELTPFSSFTTQSKLPFTKMSFIHEMKESAGKRVVTHKIEMTGLGAPLFSKLLGKNLADSLPLALSKMILLAEQQ